MKEHTVIDLLEILSSSKVGLDALTTQVAIFGVLQHAHASATSEDEFGLEYVRAFLSMLKQRTANHAKIMKITLVLQQKLQEKCDRVHSQIRLLGKSPVSTALPAEGNAAASTQLRNLVAKPVASQPTRGNNTPVSRATPDSRSNVVQSDESATKRVVHAQVVMAKKNPGTGKISPATDPRVLGVRTPTGHVPSPVYKERTNEQSVPHTSRPLYPQPPSGNMAVGPNVPYARHSEAQKHLYTGFGVTGNISETTKADIKNYAEPGEDLDWTKITEPHERKRLQNIINGRKYRERRLAEEGKSGSGGNYPGAAGEGSTLSTGYGRKRIFYDGFLPTGPLQPSPVVATSAKPKAMAESGKSFQRPQNVRQGSPTVVMSTKGTEPVMYHSLDEIPREFWTNAQSTGSTYNGEGAAYRNAHKLARSNHVLDKSGQGSSNSLRSLVLGEEPAATKTIPDKEKEVKEKHEQHAAHQNSFPALLADLEEFADEEQPFDSEKDPADFTDSECEMSPASPTVSGSLRYDSDDDCPDHLIERDDWQPNAGDAAFFQCDKPLKTAFNIFARSAHDAHRFPAKTRKNVVEKYHMSIRQVWNGVEEEDKVVWRTIASRRSVLSALEMSAKGQYLLQKQGLVGKFHPETEPSFS